MRSKIMGRLLDLGTLRLERAVKRLREQDHRGALDDLYGALHHMHKAGADAPTVQHLTAIIAEAERKAS